MNSSSGLTKKDSSRIGFVVSSLFSEALNVSEMHEWITHVMGSEATTPGYLFVLFEFRGPLFKIYETIGFVPHWPYTDDEKLALLGIAFKRGREPFDPPIDRETALKKLHQYPHIEERFRATFP